MIRTLQSVAFAFLLLVVADATGDEPSRTSHAFEGIWSGSWGGGQQGDVVFQPVLAELIIVRDHAEFHGFPNLNNPSGKVRFDAQNQRMHFIPMPRAGQPAAEEIQFTYKFKDDQLTLVTKKKASVTLRRESAVGRPAINTRLEIFPTAKIDDSGKLNLDRFAVLQVADSPASFLGPVRRTLKIDESTIGVIEESGWRKITLEQARAMIRAAPPVAVLHKTLNSPPIRQVHKLWKMKGPPPTDSDAVWTTLSRSLRPGTIVFIMQPEQVPLP